MLENLSLTICIEINIEKKTYYILYMKNIHIYLLTNIVLFTLVMYACM